MPDTAVRYGHAEEHDTLRPKEGLEDEIDRALRLDALLERFKAEYIQKVQTDAPLTFDELRELSQYENFPPEYTRERFLALQRRQQVENAQKREDRLHAFLDNYVNKDPMTDRVVLLSLQELEQLAADPKFPSEHRPILDEAITVARNIEQARGTEYQRELKRAENFVRQVEETSEGEILNLINKIENDGLDQFTEDELYDVAEKMLAFHKKITKEIKAAQDKGKDVTHLWKFLNDISRMNSLLQNEGKKRGLNFVSEVALKKRKRRKKNGEPTLDDEEINSVELAMVAVTRYAYRIERAKTHPEEIGGVEEVKNYIRECKKKRNEFLQKAISLGYRPTLRERLSLLF